MTHLIVGLGNPGKEYIGTRHNIGRDVLLNFAEKNNFPTFSENKKFNALVSEGNISGKKIILLLPETFMNLSGDSIQKAMKFFKIKPENILVLQDEIDLPFGSSKISFNKNSGGHKGIADIILKLKTKEFWRIRIGINPTKKKKDAMTVVLKKFSKKEEDEIKKLKKKINEALFCTVLKSPQKAMELYNRK
jgi:PTH1 family peptidyl-tRNA hydrolase